MAGLERLEQFFNALLVLLFVVAIIIYVFQPAKFGLLVGYSMTPAMTDGDIFIYDPGEPAVTDEVVVFKSEEHNKLIAHRVVKKNETHYVTKGDNNTYRDEPIKVDSSNYHGKMITHIPTPWEFPVDQDRVLQYDNPVIRAFAN